MAFDTNAFVQDLLKDVQVDDAAKAALQATLTNPAVAKRLEESTLRQSDYSKKLDDYNKKVAAAQDYWDGLVKWDKEAKAALEREKALVRQKLVDEGVNLDNLEGPKPGVVDDEKLKKLAQESLSYMNTISKLGMRHFKEFGEILDPDQLVELATKEGTNINIAYDRMVQPKREELQKVDIEKQLAKAREEGKAEALKNIQIPVAEQPFSNAVPSAVDALNKKPEERSGYGSMAAVKAWQENRSKGNPLPF